MMTWHVYPELKFEEGNAGRPVGRTLTAAYAWAVRLT
jgi:hypothetical protein